MTPVFRKGYEAGLLDAQKVARRLRHKAASASSKDWGQRRMANRIISGIDALLDPSFSEDDIAEELKA